MLAMWWQALAKKGLSGRELFEGGLITEEPAVEPADGGDESAVATAAGGAAADDDLDDVGMLDEALWDNEMDSDDDSDE